MTPRTPQGVWNTFVPISYAQLCTRSAPVGYRDGSRGGTPSCLQEASSELSGHHTMAGRISSTSAHCGLGGTPRDTASGALWGSFGNRVRLPNVCSLCVVVIALLACDPTAGAGL